MTITGELMTRGSPPAGPPVASNRATIGTAQASLLAADESTGGAAEPASGSSVRTELLPVRSLSETERVESLAFTRHILGASSSRVPPFALLADGYRWAGPTWSVMVKCDGHVVSQVGVLMRLVHVGSQPVLVAGIGGLMTLPAYRGRGYAHATLEKAVSFAARRLGVSFALRLCPSGTRPFGAPLAWQIMDCDILCEQAGGPVPLGGEKAVVLALGSRIWPKGLLDLGGEPW